MDSAPAIGSAPPLQVDSAPAIESAPPVQVGPAPVSLALAPGPAPAVLNDAEEQPNPFVRAPYNLRSRAQNGEHVPRVHHPDGNNPHFLLALSFLHRTCIDTSTNTTMIIPKNRREALHPANKHRCTWQKAMDKELAGLTEKRTFDDSQPMPAGMIALDIMWVYSFSSSKQMPKARLVVRGDQQRPFIDFTPSAITAATCRMASVRTLLALAAQLGWHVRQGDVAQAFVQSELVDHVIWIKNPIPGGAPIRLRKSLYGLRQAAALWACELARTLRSLGYFPISADSCVFAKRVPRGMQSSFISVFVDDLAFFSPDLKEIERVQAGLAKRYSMFDLGAIRNLLGLVVHRVDLGPISISQAPYAQELLDRFADSSVTLRSHPTPLPCSKTKLVPNDGHATQSATAMFQAAVGAINYLATTTRPDLSFAVSTLSKFLQNPSAAHCSALQHLLGYISGTIHHKLYYPVGGSRLSAYSDADHAGCGVTHRSTSGGAIMLGDSLTQWFCRLQHSITLSSTEAETVAATLVASELLWYRQFLCDIGMPVKGPSVIYCDNLSTIAASKQQWHQSKSKSIALRMAYLRERIESKCVALKPVRSEEQAADFLTKNVSGPTLHHLLRKIGMEMVRGSFSKSETL